MDLLEYQAKELFRAVGIPVLPSQRIDRTEELKNLRIPFPVVLKSQVYAESRGKQGGIKFANNTIDAIAAARSIWNLSIMGQYPRVLLAEAMYQPDREFYLAVTIDRSARRPILLGSQQGGEAIESDRTKIHPVIVDQEFSPFYARRLALQMGLQGELLRSVSTIVQKMYRLFVQKDLDLVEINPLAVSGEGELMALDGKVIANDDALGRHPDIAAWQVEFPNATDVLSELGMACNREWISLERGDRGHIAVICSGAGLTMATLDLLHAEGGVPACFQNLGGDCRYNMVDREWGEHLRHSLDQIGRDRQITVVLVNLIGGGLSGDEVGQAIADYWHIHGGRLAIVLRVVGNAFDQAQIALSDTEVVLVDDLDAAIAKTVMLSSSAIGVG
ncbi:MAG: succinate--CoA ligase subunit beta [Synechococcales cyanobacterium T60_A2020_003]|nr:succinate--CoA ligase subunit beta [Synechococcales cyanobacterium T60_A2020_003]